MECLNLAYGLGASILSYHLLGRHLKMPAWQAYHYYQNNLLFCPPTVHEATWKAMHDCIFLNVRGHETFKRSHRIPDNTISLPPVQIVSVCGEVSPDDTAPPSAPINSEAQVRHNPNACYF